MGESKGKRVRLNLTVTPLVRERLDRLAEKSDAGTLTEVVRRALVMYEIILDNQKAGGYLILKDSSGVPRQLWGY